MNKAQAAAALLLGATLGVGGRQAAEGLLSPGVAEAAKTSPFVHAVDLRREYQSSGVPKVTVYGNLKSAPDAGIKDLNQPTSCAPAVDTAKMCTSCMNGLARECSWP